MKQFVYGFIFAIVSIIGLGSCTEEAFHLIYMYAISSSNFHQLWR